MFPIPFFRRTPRPSTDLSTNVVESAVGRGKDSPIAKYQVRSVVSAGVEIRGAIVAREGAVIDGVVHGDVTVTAANAALLLRATARVIGNIEAPQVLVSGEVIGDITARFVRLYPGSRVFGRVSASRLLVDDGAVIDNDAIKVNSLHTAATPSHALVLDASEVTTAPLRSRDVAQERLTQILRATESLAPRS